MKGKVIEDLNESIKSLKRNLENKVREYQSAISDARDREDRLQERINSEGKGMDDLHREVNQNITNLYVCLF